MAVHALAPVDPKALLYPASQRIQSVILVEPVLGLYVPGGQAMQTERVVELLAETSFPKVLENVPAGHPVEAFTVTHAATSVWPPSLVVFPSGHLSHTDALSAPTTAE